MLKIGKNASLKNITLSLTVDEEKEKYPQEALKMLQECLDWSNKHPHNDYKDRFDGVSGVILKSYTMTKN